MVASRDHMDWVRLLIAFGSKKEKKPKLGILFMFWWQIWKERNNGVFQEEGHPAIRVAVLIKDQAISLVLARNCSSTSLNG
jgi:hypothetical protein